MLRPRDAADLAEIIAGAAGPLEPFAGGTKRAVGRPVSAEPLDLSALSGIVDYEPRELVLTARAATPLDELERVLAEHGQRLVFEPPDWTGLLGSSGRPTLGGALAANLSGSRRIAAGAARDHLLGVRAVSGSGERFTAGGRVVKNVTGYDVPKLLAGSWGTLAVLAEVTVRVHPSPEYECTLQFDETDAAAAVRSMSAALGSQCDVCAAAFRPGAGVALRLEGFRVSVVAREAMLRDRLRAPQAARLEGEDSQAFWRRVGSVEPLASSPVVWRLSVPPSDAPRIIERLAALDYLLDWGGGLVWIAAEQADPERVRAAVTRGHATLIKAPAAVRAATAVFQPLAPALAALTSRVKAALDPRGRLNPGRMD